MSDLFKKMMRNKLPSMEDMQAMNEGFEDLEDDQNEPKMEETTKMAEEPLNAQEPEKEFIIHAHMPAPGQIPIGGAHGLAGFATNAQFPHPQKPPILGSNELPRFPFKMPKPRKRPKKEVKIIKWEDCFDGMDFAPDVKNRFLAIFLTFLGNFVLLYRRGGPHLPLSARSGHVRALIRPGSPRNQEVRQSRCDGFQGSWSLEEAGRRRGYVD